MYCNFKAITRCKLIKDQRTRKVGSNLWRSFAEIRWHEVAIMNPLGRVVSLVQKFWRYCSDSISLKFMYIDAVLLHHALQEVIPQNTGTPFQQCWGERYRNADEWQPGQQEVSILCTTADPNTQVCRHMMPYHPSSAPEGQILPPPLFPEIIIT